MKERVILVLSAIFVLAYLSRVLYLPRQALTFGYDQARDAFVVQEILAGDIKILGPPASTPGLYHGVFYYYLLSPAYLIGGGNPIAAAYWIAFLNAASIALIYYLTFQLTKKVGVGLLASFIFAISFEATQYATWLSNPTIGVWTVPLIYIGLWAWLCEKKKWGPVACALGLGLSIQAEIFLAYHIVPVAFWLWTARKSLSRKTSFFFLGTLVLSLSSIIIAEFKFGFKSFSGMGSLFLSHDSFLNKKSFGDFFLLYLNQFGRFFANSVLPSNVGYGGALGIGLLGWLFKKLKDEKTTKSITWQPFLATFLLSHLTVVSVGGVSTPFLTVGLGGAAVVTTAIALGALWEKRKALALILFLILVLSNILTILKENKKGSTIFAIQPDMLLSKEMSAVDFTYQESEGRPFSINTFSSPLWVNTTWSYLYNWYGKEKYGYLPQWHGRNQVGQLGNNLATTAKGTTDYFFIIEPLQGIPSSYLPLEIGSENAKSTIFEEKNFGEIQVQKRVRI